MHKYVYKARHPVTFMYVCGWYMSVRVWVGKEKHLLVIVHQTEIIS